MNIRIDSVHIFWGPKYSDSSNISISIEGLGGMDVRDGIPQGLIDQLQAAAIQVSIEKLDKLVEDHTKEPIGNACKEPLLIQEEPDDTERQA